ncbi:MAG TPA: twin-arginine translocase subunit TatC, partial [Segetibacter sp.]
MASILRKLRPDSEEMTFVDHLEELRWHIVRSLLAILFFAIFIFINIDWVFENVITGPLHDNFVSYTAMCRFSRWIHLGDALCMPSINIK